MQGPERLHLQVEVPPGILYFFLPHVQFPLDPQIPGRTTEDIGVTTHIL